MDIIFKPKQVTKIFAYTVMCLTLAHIVGQCIAFYLGYTSKFKPIVSWLDLDVEQSIPTFYSSIALLFCSSLLAIITIAKKKNGERYIYWLGLAIIFLFLSVDESLTIHESLTDKVRTALNTSGLLYCFAWIIPYSIALIVSLLVYIKFILNLPSRIRILFITAGLIYVSGAIGVELVGGRYSELHSYNVTFLVITTVEELLEMAGVVIFIFALTSYIDIEFKGLRLGMKSSN